MIPCIQIYSDATGNGFKTFISELYCMVTQALLWKKLNNGPTYLYTDEESLEMIRSIGLLHIWDKINTKVLSSESDIDSEVFWASAKHRVMETIETPFVICDLDFLSWFEVGELKEYDFVGYHAEDFENNLCYSETNPLKLMPHSEFSWDVNPVNTAFILMSSSGLKQEYCKVSIDFMKASSMTPDEDEDSRRMVFIEQWFLASLLKRRGYHSKTLLNSVYNEGTWKKRYKDIFNPFARKCFHIWHDKFEFIENPSLELKHIQRISKLIQKYGISDHLEDILKVDDEWLAYPKKKIYKLLKD